jgi:hypothetical protein
MDHCRNVVIAVSAVIAVAPLALAFLGLGQLGQEQICWVDHWQRHP